LIGQEEKTLEAAKLLLDHGILIPAIRTPTVPKGKARLRLTVSSAHSDKEIEQVLKALHEIRGK
jgi:8-amino-7-oxononanoate synthase